MHHERSPISPRNAHRYFIDHGLKWIRPSNHFRVPAPQGLANPQPSMGPRRSCLPAGQAGTPTHKSHPGLLKSSLKPWNTSIFKSSLIAKLTSETGGAERLKSFWWKVLARSPIAGEGLLLTCPAHFVSRPRPKNVRWTFFLRAVRFTRPARGATRNEMKVWAWRANNISFQEYGWINKWTLITGYQYHITLK